MPLTTDEFESLRSPFLLTTADGASQRASIYAQTKNMEDQGLKYRRDCPTGQRINKDYGARTVSRFVYIAMCTTHSTHLVHVPVSMRKVHLLCSPVSSIFPR